MNLPELKQPPHSDEAETMVLSAMINHNRLINDLDWLHTEDFYRHENQVIFNRLGMMALIGKPVDPVTLVEALDEADELTGSLTIDYIADMAVSGRGASNAIHYAQIVQEHAKSRRLIQAGYKITELGYDKGDSQSRIDEAQSLIMGFTSSGENEPQDIRDVLRAAVDDIERRSKMGGQIVGLNTGFPTLDKLTAGFQEGQLIIIAGRPGSGKTTFAMNICENVIMQGKNVLVFNLEMTAINLVLKSLSSMGNIPYSDIRSGTVGSHQQALALGGKKLIDKSLKIDDNASLTSAQILSRARKVQQKLGKKLDLVIVDYMQLLNDKGEGHERITKISRALKLTAKQLGCPVIALSQLNRSLENRTNKKPIMADLRESGAIEQDADTIIMIYRDELHNEESKEKGIAEALVRKNREGETGSVFLAARLDVCRFDELDPRYIPQRDKETKSTFAYLDD